VLAIQRAAGNLKTVHLLVSRQEIPLAQGPGQEHDDPRQAFLVDATREFETSPRHRAIILAALGAFGVGQLDVMRRAGIRFWGEDGVPPVFEGLGVAAPRLESPASFIGGIRLIRIGGRTSRHAVVHELAHAWDFVQGLRTHQRLDDLSPAQRRRSIEQGHQRPPFRSASTSRLPTVERGPDAQPRSVRLTIREMWRRYLDRVTRREEAFDGPDTREGHSQRSPQEFYAEGYAVFHGSSPIPKEKLQRYAPELYALLKSESHLRPQ
jgi:hypothetical protein